MKKGETGYRTCFSLFLMFIVSLFFPLTLDYGKYQRT
jgi:hypothetical protein